MGVFEKLLSISTFFFKKLNTDLNLLFLIKHHLEKIREGIIKNKLNYHWQDTRGKIQYLLFILKFVSSCCFDLLKKGHISNFNEISLKKQGN